MESSSKEIKKIKHREVERVRHHKLQSLINQLTEVVPSVNKTITQCAILKKTADYVKFLITENKRIYDIIEVDGYSSSQGTVTSSQGNLVIDEREQFNSSFDENQRYREENERISKCPPLPSALFSPDQEYFDFNSLPVPIPPDFQSTKWIDYQSPYPSPPSTSTSPPQPSPLQPPPPPPPPQYIQPIGHQNLNHHQPHCPSCCCYSSHNNMGKQFNNHNIKSFVPRDHLLTETIQDYGINDQSLSSWA